MFDVLWANLPYLMRGATKTLMLAGAYVTAGTVLGVMLGSVTAFAPWPFRAVVGIYVHVIRGIPILVLMFIAYYGPPSFGIRLPDFVAVGIALALYTGSFVTEITRGSILAVPRGQLDAARSIGMTSAQVLRLVILPQAARAALPSLVNNSVIMIKATAYVSLVGVWELTYAAREVVERTQAPFAIFVGVMMLYFSVCFPLSRLALYLEKRLAYRN